MKKTSQLCQQHRAEFFLARDREAREKEAESRIKTLYAICWLCELRKLQLGSIKNKQWKERNAKENEKKEKEEFYIQKNFTIPENRHYNFLITHVCVRKFEFHSICTTAKQRWQHTHSSNPIYIISFSAFITHFLENIHISSFRHNSQPNSLSLSQLYDMLAGAAGGEGEKVVKLENL